MAASCRLSGFVTYFCISNRFSSPLRWRFEKTARDHDLFFLLVEQLATPTGPPDIDIRVDSHGDTWMYADDDDGVEDEVSSNDDGISTYNNVNARYLTNRNTSDAIERSNIVR